MPRKPKGRRVNGEGSIFPYRNGFRALLRIGGGQRKAFDGPTQASVRDKLREYQQKLAQGEPTGRDHTMPLRELLDRWLDSKSVRVNTKVNYGIIVSRHIVPALGDWPLSKIRPLVIQDLIDAKKKEGLAPATVRHIHRVLYGAFAFAVHNEMVGRNPALKTALPALPQGTTEAEQHALTVEQANRLRRFLRGQRGETMFSLALFTGLRRGELLGLRWSDVDLVNATIDVRQAVQRLLRGGGLACVPLKTVRSRRQVSLMRFLVPMLTAHKAAQAARKLKLGPRWQSDPAFGDLVFPHQTGGPLDPRNVTRIFQRCCKQAGLGHFRLHDLRHTAATFAHAAGASAKEIQDMLGHSSIAVTMNIYTHLFPTAQRAVADKMEAMLEASGTE